MSRGERVMVAKDAFESEDPWELVGSNVQVVNALYDADLQDADIPPAALASFYVDFYLTQVNDGGFSQFVFQSQWNGEIVRQVAEGLRAMGATAHLALFERAAMAIEKLDEEQLEAYMDGDYLGDDPEWDFLDEGVNVAFFALRDAEDLVTLNAGWLRAQPELQALDPAELAAEVARRGAARRPAKRQKAVARG